MRRMKDEDTMKNQVYKALVEYVSMRDFSPDEICH